MEEIIPQVSVQGEGNRCVPRKWRRKHGKKNYEHVETTEVDSVIKMLRQSNRPTLYCRGNVEKHGRHKLQKRMARRKEWKERKQLYKEKGIKSC